jgi:hypothetical protein
MLIKTKQRLATRPSARLCSMHGEQSVMDRVQQVAHTLYLGLRLTLTDQTVTMMAWVS